MSEQKNFIKAIALSLLIIIVVDRFFSPDAPVATEGEAAVELGVNAPAISDGASTDKPVPAETTDIATKDADVPVPDEAAQATGEVASEKSAENANKMRAKVLANDSANRLAIDTAKLKGSIKLKGARIDDLVMKNHTETIEEGSANVPLLSPVGSYEPQYIEQGWVVSAKNKDVKVPDANSIWTADSDLITTDKPVTLSWNNGQGFVFTKIYHIDADYLINVKQAVQNNTGKDIALYPYGLIKKVRKGKVERSVVHSGPVAYLNEELEEVKDGDFDEDNGGKLKFETTGGWLGITEKYWMTTLLLDQTKDTKARISASGEDENKTLQVDYLYPALTVKAGETASVIDNIFTGAKEIKLLDKYEDELGIEHFDLAIDFGWYYFLTKPFLYILTWFNGLFSSMGIAILLVTILLRAAMYPVANASYKSMTKMKKVQPKVQRLQKLYDHDKMKLQQELMKLYKKEEINPAAGCVPMLLQIPVFFSLYKVLSISIEMRHAPFYGWIKDLSSPDPTSVFTLFGTIPLPLPGFLDIGVWPLVMGLTMLLQQKLSPQPTEKGQARMMLMMPVLFTFMLGQFAAGLVIYWTLSNIIGIIQQKIIMKQMNVE
jgi:YidC/Oxa1 family membrane protein insertase